MLANDRSMAGAGQTSFIISHDSSAPRIMKKDAHILLCCDVDPDKTSFGATGETQRNEVRWEGLTKGVPAFIDTVSSFEDEQGDKIRFNWFFRSDLQLERLHGDPAWPHRARREVVERILKRNDELGWHPHFWRLHEDGVSWYQETDDLDYLGSCLKRGFNAIPPELRPLVARTGCDFHNAFTMRCLAELGLVADLSALPGIEDAGTIDPRTQRRVVVRNWAGAPDRPYFPSKEDHRVEAHEESDRLGIIEIPVSTYALPSTMKMAKGLRDKLRGSEGKPRYSEPYLTGRNMLFKAALNHHLKRRDPSDIPMVVEFHADDLLQASGAHSTKNAIENISTSLNAFRKAGLRPSFSLASEVAKELRARMEE